MKRSILPLLLLLLLICSKEALSAITLTVPTNGAGQNETDLSSYVTDSITPTANTVYVAFFSSVVTSGTANALDPTTGTQGFGVTWTPIGDTLLSNSSLVRRLNAWRCNSGSSPTTGSITFNVASAQTQTRGIWTIVKCAGVNTTTPVVQSKIKNDGTTSTTLTNTLDNAIANPNNVTLGLFGHSAVEVTNTSGGATELDDQQGASALSCQVEYLANSTTLTATWATNTARACIAFELNSVTISIPVIFHLRSLMSFIFWRTPELCYANFGF